MGKGCFIQAGSKIIFYVNDEKYAESEAVEDIEISTNVITMIDGALVSTDNINPVEKISDNEYRVNCCWQDCMYISDGKAFNSINNAN